MRFENLRQGSLKNFQVPTYKKKLAKSYIFMSIFSSIFYDICSFTRAINYIQDTFLIFLLDFLHINDDEKFFIASKFLKLYTRSHISNSYSCIRIFTIYSQFFFFF